MRYGFLYSTQGGYICQCPPYYELTESGNACVGQFLFLFAKNGIQVNSWRSFLMIDRRKSQCYLDTQDDFISSRGRRPGQFGPRECTRPVGDLMTRATCCCSVGNAWGPLCESCPNVGSEEYNNMCPGGSGFRPNGQTVSKQIIMLHRSLH